MKNKKIREIILGAHTHLGLYMAIATAVIVFIIALAYNQVIELFPTGGIGWAGVAGMLMLAYSLGGGTYTGQGDAQPVRGETSRACRW